MLTIEEILSNEGNVSGLARALGRVCLDHEEGIGRARAAHPAVERQIAAAELALAQLTEARWDQAEQSGGGFLDLVTHGDAWVHLRRLRTYRPLAHLALLRGLCLGVLAGRFRRQGGRVKLERGDPFPLPDRPRHRDFPDLTPAPDTIHDMEPLRRTGFALFRGAPHGITCMLDFSLASALDAASWDGDSETGRFHRLATAHPATDPAELEVGHEAETKFFEVAPRDWDPEEVVAQLRIAGRNGARSVLVPELALPHPDALAERIRASHRALPSLIVAGSAHVRWPRDPPVSANEGVAYLHGAKLLRYRKVRPYKTKQLGRDGRERVEDLSPEPKTMVVACGRHTRLGVVICADLNDSQIPDLLPALGINLLLVPALTPRAGAFSGTASGIASRCQGVTVVANGPASAPPGKGRQRPFQILASVPHQSANDQLKEYRPPRSGRKGVGVLDLNQPLRRSLKWIALPRKGRHLRALRSLFGR